MAFIAVRVQAHAAHLAGGDDAVAELDVELRIDRLDLERLDGDALAEPLREVAAHRRVGQAGGDRVVALEDQALQAGAERRQEGSLARRREQQLDQLAAHVVGDVDRRHGATVAADAKREGEVSAIHRIALMNP